MSKPDQVKTILDKIPTDLQEGWFYMAVLHSAQAPQS